MTEIIVSQNISVNEKNSTSIKSNGNGTNTSSSHLSTMSRFKDLILDSDSNVGLEDEILPEYKRMQIVGKGSFGVAILYKRVSDEILVVLKQINLSDLTISEKELAMNEVEVFSKLHHPNIISYLGSFIRGETLIIEMEYADKGTLAQIINDRAPNDYLPENQIVNIFEQITSAINYMHSQNILHRDLKTANVFLNSRGTVKIGDFGISKIMSTKIHAQTVLGTPYYFSPEMCEGKEYDEKSDMWALGCILGEMCCLKKAFAASNLSELVAKIMSAHYLPLPSGYSNELRHVIRLLLQIEPNERPSASEVLQYWIPLVYRNATQRKNGNQYIEDNSNDTYQNIDPNEREFEQNETIMNESTVSISERIVERSVLYQLKSFAGSISLNPLQLPPTIKISHVATSESHFIVVTTEGLVYTWGEGNSGQLGHGSVNTWKHYPTKVESLRKYNIVGASAGEGFSLFWTETGITLSCGDNSKGCLGHGSLSSYLTPKVINKLNGIEIIQIASGVQHVVALSSYGCVFIWGASNYNIGSQNWFNIPRTVEISHLNDIIVAVRCGPDCTILILKNGDLYACGKNTNNRLGFGKKVTKINSFKKVSVINKKVIDVSIAQTFVAFLIEGGYVVTMGQNCDGQRGLGHSNSNEIHVPTMVTGIKHKFITKVKCSSSYVVAFSDDNIISLWGKRFGIPEESRTNSNSTVLNRPLDTFDRVNNTAAFTNFLTSVYKSEKILDPIDILALYSSDDQRSKGYFVKLENIFPLHHSILVLVTTTTPLGYN